MVFLVVRISGRCKMNKKREETLKRLKLQKKFSARFIEEKDDVMKGMMESVQDEVMYGKVEESFAKKVKEKRLKEGKNVLFLHPPVGGFKKTTKERYPKGIRGNNPNIVKIVERML
jgi:ribosomal protein L30/L7E